MLVVAAVMVVALFLAGVVLAFVAYEHGHRPPRAPERVASAIDRVASTVRVALDEPEQGDAHGVAPPRSPRSPRPSRSAALKQPVSRTRPAVGPVGQRVRAARRAVQQLTIDLTDDTRASRRPADDGAPSAQAQWPLARPTVARHGAGRRT